MSGSTWAGVAAAATTRMPNWNRGCRDFETGAITDAHMHVSTTTGTPSRLETPPTCGVRCSREVARRAPPARWSKVARHGAKRIRTADLLGAIQALSQLSY